MNDWKGDGRREREVFDAVHAVPPHERPALIAALCGDDAELAARIRRLLVADLAATPLDVPPLASAERDPVRIGAYDIVGRIGEGGMGVVYLADQVSPVRRRVALKVVKPGMDSREVVARFEAERQALALMTHPNIARIIDGGATEDGRPYFVMEHVPGAPLTRWCDQRSLAIDERLMLFVQVCDALQHAHQKGVVHRDLKPSNVIVTELDGRPVPKVIDFGIAKAIGQPLAEAGAQTRIGHLIGTPDYMSPEQFEWAAHDIDTRADVYALGVLLYELLAGALPFDFQARRLSLAEIEAEIRQRDPPPPSAAARAADAEVIAARGMRDGPDLANQLAGDLDWIVAKAMAKERERRYASARELAADLERHLANQPVSAGPPSGWYVMAKFARRNLLPVSLLATTFVLTVAFAVMMAVQVQETARARDRANLEAAKAREVSRFLTDMFEQADPASGGGADVTAREILDRGARRIRSELGSQPELRAELLAVMGRAYRTLEINLEASVAFEEALVALRAAGAERTPEAFVAREQLALVRDAAGDRQGGEREIRAALAEAEQALGAQHETTIRLRVTLAGFLRGATDFDGAERELNAALRGIEARGLQGGEVHVNALLEIAYVSMDRGPPKAADAPLAAAVERAKAHYGARHPEVLVGLAKHAQLKMVLGELDAAETLFREALAISDEVYGPENRLSASMLADLGNIHFQRKDLARSEEHMARAHAMMAKVLGSEHRSTLSLLGNLAVIRFQRGDAAGARRDFEQVYAARRAAFGADHPETAVTLANLARAYAAEGRGELAERRMREALAILTAKLGDEHWRTANGHRNYGEILERIGRRREAEREFALAHGIMLRTLGAEHQRTRDAAAELARLRAGAAAR